MPIVDNIAAKTGSGESANAATGATKGTVTIFVPKNCFGPSFLHESL
jgi:hypothetical protein